MGGRGADSPGRTAAVVPIGAPPDHCLMRTPTRVLLALLPVLAFSGPPTIAEPTRVIRINQLGYLPNAPKTAVMCALPDSTSGAPAAPTSVTFAIEDTNGRRILGPRRATAAGPFGPCAETYRLDFSSLRAPGRYVVVSDRVRSPVIRIDARAYAGAADTLLYYMRQQRSGYNPTLRDSVHKRDGLIVDHPTRTGEF